DVHAFARMGAYEALLSGTTTVWDHYYHGHALGHAIRDVGLTGVVAPTLQDLSGPGASHTERAIAATVAIAEDTELADAGIVVAVGPHATDTVSDSLWSRVVSLATELRVPVHVHLSQSVEEYLRSIERHGVSPIQHLEQLGILASDL